jgi:hypothetical protein
MGRRTVDERERFKEPTKTLSRRKVRAGVTVAALVIAAAGVTTVTLDRHNHGTSSSVSTRSEVAGLDQFAREWRGMRERIEIDRSGHGRFHYMMACATCSMAEMPYNTIDFTFTSVSGRAANGSVTNSSDPYLPVGESVAAILSPHDTIQWVVGGKNVGLFCGSDFAWCGS